MRTIIFVSVVLVATFGTVVHSNDAAVMNVGGTIKLLSEHKTVEMIAEHVTIDLSRRDSKVECVFFFHNAGPKTSVKMGFPDYSSFDKGPLKSFESFIDGRRVEVEVSDPVKDALGGVTYWWLKDVDFEQGQTLVVRDCYEGGRGGDSVGRAWFTYWLHTGSSWSGTIGTTSVVLKLDEFSTKALAKIEPEGYELDDHEVRWTFHDFEPVRGAKNGRIRVEWSWDDVN